MKNYHTLKGGFHIYRCHKIIFFVLSSKCENVFHYKRNFSAKERSIDVKVWIQIMEQLRSFIFKSNIAYVDKKTNTIKDE